MARAGEGCRFTRLFGPARHDPIVVDRFEQFENSKGKTLGELLETFAERRRKSRATLRSWNLSGEANPIAQRDPEHLEPRHQ